MSKFNNLINGDTPVFVDFSAEWCQPCKMMPPILKQVKKEMGDKLRIIKVDVDKNAAIAGRYGIQNIPTFLIFKKGNVVFRQSGVMQVNQIKSAVKQFIE